LKVCHMATLTWSRGRSSRPTFVSTFSAAARKTFAKILRSKIQRSRHPPRSELSGTGANVTDNHNLPFFRQKIRFFEYRYYFSPISCQKLVFFLKIDVMRLFLMKKFLANIPANN
jgi:hypothetical protein